MSLDKFTKEYQVNTAGKQNGVDIPSGFRVVVMDVTTKPRNIPADDISERVSGWDLIIKAHTYEDSTHSRAVINDDLKRKCVLDLGTSNPTSAPKTLVTNNFDAIMDSIYGSENVVANPA